VHSDPAVPLQPEFEKEADICLLLFRRSLDGFAASSALATLRFGFLIGILRFAPMSVIIF